MITTRTMQTIQETRAKGRVATMVMGRVMGTVMILLQLVWLVQRTSMMYKRVSIIILSYSNIVSFITYVVIN